MSSRPGTDSPVELFVKAGAVRLSCRVFEGTDRPILALHGLASNARWWDLVARHLSPPHRVIAPDLRGHGRSDKPPSGYSFAEVGADLVSLVKALHVREPLVVGHSWGASVALWLGSHLEGVAGVVCVDGGVADLHQVFGDSWAEARERMRPPTADGLFPEELRQLVAASEISEEVGEDAALFAIMGNFEEGEDTRLRPRLDLNRHMEIAEALYDFDLEHAWKEVRCPVLYVLADDGSLGTSTKRARALHAQAAAPSGARVVFVSGSHDLPVQHPSAVAESVREFLGEIG